MSETGQKPLKNERHESFAVHYAVNGNAAQAWLAAGGDNPKQADVNGSKWSKRGSIPARIKWLKAEAARRMEVKVEKANSKSMKLLQD